MQGSNQVQPEAWTIYRQLKILAKPELIFELGGRGQADPWQVDILRKRPKRAILNTSRQVGKSTTLAAIAIYEALYPDPAIDGDIILLSKSMAQAKELLKRTQKLYTAMGRPMDALPFPEKTKLEFTNGISILSLPESEETIRGYTARMLIIDEASRVDDDVIEAAIPMLATTNGALYLASTPLGKTGTFYKEWNQATATDDWQRYQVEWFKCPRLANKDMAKVQKRMGEDLFKREYCCEFVDLLTQAIPTKYIEQAQDMGSNVATIDIW